MGGRAKGDRWSRWHEHDRTRAGSRAANEFMQRQYEETSRRLLRLASLRPGERVLDVGAGIGMLTEGARAALGAAGLVFSLDVAVDALRKIPRRGPPDAARVEPLVGCLPDLPVAGESVDVVLCRSVLIYVRQKEVAAQEMLRVLRPGGRAAVYEPINKPSGPYLWTWDLDLGPLRSVHERILAHLDATWEDREATMDFDEHDLEESFWRAGFRMVRIQYDQTRTRDVWAPALFKGYLRNRATGTMLSYEEAAQDVLGPNEAADHLHRFDAILDRQAGSIALAQVLLLAEKH